MHLVDAQRILRESARRITQEVYTHVDRDQLRSAIHRMLDRIDNFPAAADGDVDAGDGRKRGRNNVTTTEFRRAGKGISPRCTID